MVLVIMKESDKQAIDKKAEIVFNLALYGQHPAPTDNEIEDSNKAWREYIEGFEIR